MMDFEQKKPLTLYELNALVRETVELSMPDEYWVEAEIAEAREVRGHCYMHLVQKDLFSNTPVAQAPAKCWKQTWQAIRPRFERVTGQELHAGMKVLLLVFAQFHENYGFSWIVSDIDPTYTLGDMARRRQEIVNLLKAEGVFDMQKGLSLPLFCQRIAVISSAQAAGYGDFVNQLEGNAQGFCFQIELFPAIMQGEQVEQSVIAALDKINSQGGFDCVVIIRGGGATADLSGFDTLALAENVANFPLPIITGIGHERDESIIDMVSHTRVKTPTAAAAFLIDHLQTVSDCLADAQDRVARAVRQRLETEGLRVTQLQQRLQLSVINRPLTQSMRLDRLETAMVTALRRRLERESHRLDVIERAFSPVLLRKLMSEQHRLQLLEQRSKAVDPTLLLKRGYSITIHDGHVVRNASQLRPGDEIVTHLEKGSVKSIITDEG